ncbi:MAG: hypothetical protein JXA54_15285 [Candidatus Heimdallarchaeota archaeon]|nr:hypothetical protein [Candidatus Heimdallarchaeota archaeon]
MKQVVFHSPRVLEEVATITGDYFSTQVSGCAFNEDAYYENNRVRVMRISHSMTLMSYGEDYHFVFERLPDPKMQTKITISITLKFGYGAQWKKPSDILIRWANLVGVEPIDFGRKPFIVTWAILGSILALFILVPSIIALILTF